MPFPRDVREQALVAAARHCCVCHRFKGLKIEVHHIVQEASGGPNTFDNAVVLCFDCHSEAGHYNASHPRGTKFSPSELRRARDGWFALVSQHRISPAAISGLIHTRHLVCKSPEEANALLEGRFADLPLGRNLLLMENPVASFARDILRAVGAQRSAVSSGNEYPSPEDYEAHHPDSHVSRLAYFSAMRTPVLREVADPLSARLANEGAPVSDLARAYCYYEECGTPSLSELIRYRPLLFAFLEVRNEANTPIRLHGITGRITAPVGSLGYRAFVGADGDPASMLLPKAALRPGESALIPLSAMLGPLDAVTEQDTIAEHRQNDSWLVLARERWPVPSTYDFRAIGPSLRPESLTLTIDDRTEEVPVHTLDLGNTFTLARFWAVGSCPHLFWQDRATSDWVYGGPLLGRGQGDACTELVPVPASARSFCIAELEQEVTYLEHVTLHTRGVAVLLHEAATLQEGHAITGSLSEEQEHNFVLEVRGHYVPLRGALPRPSSSAAERAWVRACIVEKHLERVPFRSSTTQAERCCGPRHP